MTMKLAGFRPPWSAGRRIALAALVVVLPAVSQAEPLRMGGTGAGLALMREIGEQLSAVHPEIKAEILPSLGTQGGLRALGERAIEVAIALRPLTSAEKASGLSEAACAVTPFAFVSSRPRPPGLTTAQVPALYANPAPVWPDGQPLRPILRSRDGSENPYLMHAIPGLDTALPAAYRHSGIPVGATDQENADLAQRTEGSLAVMTLLQLRTEKLKLQPVTFDGVEPTPENVASGRYRLPIRLCLVLPAHPSSTAVKFVTYVKSPPGQALLRASGAAPSD